jgi:hypothetical protein
VGAQPRRAGGGDGSRRCVCLPYRPAPPGTIREDTRTLLQNNNNDDDCDKCHKRPNSFQNLHPISYWGRLRLAYKENKEKLQFFFVFFFVILVGDVKIGIKHFVINSLTLDVFVIIIIIMLIVISDKNVQITSKIYTRSFTGVVWN